MQCTKRVSPHSKFNYVKCTRKQRESFVDILPETTNLGAKVAVMEMAQNANAVSEMPGTVANAVSEMPTLAKTAVVGLADGITDSVADMSKMAKAGIIGLVKSSDSTDTTNTTVPIDDTSCNKKNLHVTIAILIMIILGLISYIIYKQMKSN